MQLEPENGESRYRLGYCLAYLGRFAEAIPAFAEAERILGPEPRILLNRAICHANLGESDRAAEWFLKLVTGEIEAGRAGSAEARSAFQWLWRLHAGKGNWPRAEALFSKLAARYPDVTSAQWFLAHALLAQGKAGDAVEPLTRVTEIVPGWRPGWKLLGSTLVKARRFDRAVAVLRKELSLDPSSGAPLDLLLEIVEGYVETGRRGEALELLAAEEKAFPREPALFERRADLLFAAGRPAEAVRNYRKAEELNPFGDEIPIKEQKAVTALLRKGGAPADLGRLRGPMADTAPPGSGGMILDFERSGVFARVHGAASGRREGGRFSLRRRGEPGKMANLTLLFIPTLDARPWRWLTFEVKGEKGKVLLLRAKDAYDQLEVTDFFVRLLHPEPVILTGEWRTVKVPVAAFRSATPRRAIPMNVSRLRAVIFEIGSRLVPGADLAPQVLIDNVALAAEDGRRLVLADFDGEPRETLFLSDGAATPFARTLFSPAEIPGFKPDPNTFVSPAILGDRYDPGMVHGGRGSYRLTLAREGAAAGTLSFRPPRSFEKATALVFWAKGKAGGERLRVTVEDALDARLGNGAPAAVPRLATERSLLEGWFVLSREWKRYRIPRASLPDVDFRSLTRIRFLFGSPQGNPPGTVIYLDDIGWE